jgi:hypothetical protein
MCGTVLKCLEMLKIEKRILALESGRRVRFAHHTQHGKALRSNNLDLIVITWTSKMKLENIQRF